MFFKEIDEIRKKIECEVKKVGARIISPLVPPKTRIERKLLKEEIYFICAICGKEFGPVDFKNWKKLMGLMFKGGAITSSILAVVSPTVAKIPFIVIGGASGIGAYLLGEPLVDINIGVVSKKELKKKEEAKRFLIQCPSCTRWVCIDCWNTEVGECKACSPKNDEFWKRLRT